VGEIEPAASRSWALAALALTAADDGNLELAERYGRDAVQATATDRDRDDDGALGAHLAHVALAEALRLQGELAQAAEQLAQAARLTSMLPGSVYHAFTLVFEAQLELARHDRGRARGRAAAARAIVDRYPDVGTLAERLDAVEAALQRRNDDDLRGSDPTAAELRVLALLPSALTLEQIADELYVSAHTVKSHRRRLYRRLGATSRESAVMIAHARNLL
jgi:LuxR family maltose regulon positive regulatory protein